MNFKHVKVQGKIGLKWVNEFRFLAGVGPSLAMWEWASLGPSLGAKYLPLYRSLSGLYYLEFCCWNIILTHILLHLPFRFMVMEELVW